MSIKFSASISREKENSLYSCFCLVVEFKILLNDSNKPVFCRLFSGVDCEWPLVRLQHLQAELQNLELRKRRVSRGLSLCFKRLLVQAAGEQTECEK